MILAQLSKLRFEALSRPELLPAGVARGLLVPVTPWVIDRKPPRIDDSMPPPELRPFEDPRERRRFRAMAAPFLAA